MTDRERKCARLRAVLTARDLEAIWLAQPASFAWLTGGDNVVDRSADVGVAAAGYDGSTLRIVTNDIEAARLQAEELPTGISVESFEWHTTSLEAAVAERSPRPAAADFAVPGFENVTADRFRRPLTDDDVERYRDLGRQTAQAVEHVCRNVAPDTTERAVAAAVRRRLGVAGIDAPVLLVGGERRAQTYRHYTPTDETLGGYALISVTATRCGLNASCTRMVAFDPPDWLEKRHHDVARIDATAVAATRSVARRGGTAGDVFSHIQDAYADLGYPEAWRAHHQGGAAGYAGREWIATPDADDGLDVPMAYAWNPTLNGAKSEDTYLVTREGSDLLTSTGEWPVREARAIGFDVTMERPAVLRL